MLLLLSFLFVLGWIAVALVGSQAYFWGEQVKPIHERNWRSASFEQLARATTGRDIDDANRQPGFNIDSYFSQQLPSA